jgi:hypothetical protein
VIKHRVLFGAAGLALLLTGVGMAQPDESAAEQPGRQRENLARADDPALLRARLERTIARTESLLERHREALTRLDAGESPGEVMRSLRSRGVGPDESGPQTQSLRGAESGGPGIRERGGPDERALPELSPEARDGLRAFLRDQLPSVHEQLAAIEHQDSRMGATLFERMIPQLREVAMEMERNPAFGALKLDEMRTGLGVVDATQHLRSLPPDADPEIKSQAESALRSAIAARFDARMKLREHELERLAARISELHEQIKEERSGRDAEIEKVFESVIAQRWARPGRSPSERRPERP